MATVCKLKCHKQAKIIQVKQSQKVKQQAKFMHCTITETRPLSGAKSEDL